MFLWKSIYFFINPFRNWIDINNVASGMLKSGPAKRFSLKITFLTHFRWFLHKLSWVSCFYTPPASALIGGAGIGRAALRLLPRAGPPWGKRVGCYLFQWAKFWQGKQCISFGKSMICQLLSGIFEVFRICRPQHIILDAGSVQGRQLQWLWKNVFFKIFEVENFSWPRSIFVHGHRIFSC